ncbi:hypothetical protein LWI28_021084 [Acer negundo]|uniref:Uncharacterized protein n=1 Tax=Acer negundo TaxID=4023 RepID=A0AAD5JQ16_ACENE|nr:hypothetical protein LWI28_021084 [Acer negundo]
MVMTMLKRMGMGMGMGMAVAVMVMAMAIVCTVPETVFSAKFVTTLKLRNCNLEQSSGTIRFQSLKKLVLNKWFYKKMTNRDLECSNHQGIKCWQYYLRDFKIESFIPFEDQEPLHIDNLMAVLPELEAGTIRFHLD